MLEKFARSGTLASTFSPPAMQRARLAVAPFGTARVWLLPARLPLSWAAARKGASARHVVLGLSRVSGASRVSHVSGTG
eukprot:5810354-Prymnesium_polylepis.1